ncbi:MAG: ribonuclease Z [Chloroflexi bacterium]|nr:MAG: ribonuclease Z [Chloroflexota bacterium]
MSTITLLGTGTCQIEVERRASSVLLDLEGTYVLFDCGHGVVQRLLEAGVGHNQLEHIVLSHFHPDHVSDIIPFLQAGAWSQRDPRTTDIHIYGPAGVQKIIDGLLQVFGPSSLQQSSYKIVVHEITQQQFEIGSYRFDFISLPPASNHGLRFVWNGKSYAITGDSHFHDEEIAFLRDVDLAIIDSGHIEDREIVQLAVSSQAKTIVCSHLYREIDARRLQAEAANAGYLGTILVGRDLMTFVI